jgi:hypothetical protein
MATGETGFADVTYYICAGSLPCMGVRYPDRL